jgi:hypothetical protein
MATMSEFDDFLRLIVEGKKDAEEKDIGGKFLKELSVRIKGSNPFISEVNSLAEDSNDENFETDIQDSSKEFVETQTLVEEVPFPEPKTEQDSVQKYIDSFKNASFQQPDVPKVDPAIRAVQDKLKFLEQWVGKISAAGPGSGEVNLRWLDDVDRASIADDRYLKYDQRTKKFTFANPVGSEIGVLDYLQLNLAGTTETKVPGMLVWNSTEDCLDIVQSDGSTLQVGLENYIEVHNHTGSLLTNGSVVRFSGADPTIPDLPLCAPMTADYSAQPLYLIGVLTNDIPNNGSGRATILGRVHDVNTTGSDVGETWNVGDILWVHPTMPGKLTKVKPTIPQVAISVAAVVKKDATSGTLLVRPTIWPRLSYGVFSNTVDHNPIAINTAYPITIDTTNVSSGFSIASSSRITSVESGLYNFAMSAQLSSTNSSAKNIYFWIRKNGADVPYSTRSQTVNGNNTRMTFACNWTVSLNANEYVELYWAVDDTTIRLDATAATAFCPSTPSVLITVTQTAL